ncbi:MAG: L-threonylcarbamoyladenylate synthase [Crocinitomicaceae bacterium]|jgi:tRNA threonylcarbamoyl adenosine modification protein (Sua5/YciO/YrdC/YwlC family)|nr:L-threonylcarbamoyladenylate synthase [Crocinitomicaceae bacterium]
MLLEILENNIDSRLIKQAVEILKDGGILIFPTDTVYALGCDLRNKKALNNLAQMKGERLNKVNFSIICHDLSHLSDYVRQIDRPTFKLLKQNLPGPFTFILNANNDVPRMFDSKKKEIGIRIPNNKIALALVEALGNPIAATSLHNEEDEIMDYFVDPYQIFERYTDNPFVKMIIDGGHGRLEGSTVVNCTQDEFEIVRQGLGELEL